MGEVWLLQGPEKGKKKQFIKDIIINISKKEGEKPEIHRFYPFESDVAEIISTASNGSLFAAHLLFIINQAETVKAKEATQLAAFLKKTDDSITFILISDETAASKISASLTKVIPKKNKVIFWELFESDKKAWLSNFFRNENRKLSTDGLEFLLDMLENNTLEFRNVCNQLILFFDPETELTAELLEEYLYHSREETVFTLFDRIASSDLQGALDVLKKIRLGGTVYYPQLIGGLVWQLKKLYQFALLSAEHYSVDDVCKKMGIRAKKAKQLYTSAIRKFSAANLKQMIVLSTRVDSQMRESRTDLQIIQMELYLYTLIIRKGNSENFSSALSHSS